jgi:iron complex outermembrane receptor protein
VTSVPISITVADAGQLERQQVRTVEDLARIAPSLEMTAAAGQGTGGGGEIRGIGTQTFARAVASVGVVVDQVSQATPTSPACLISPASRCSRGRRAPCSG